MRRSTSFGFAVAEASELSSLLILSNWVGTREKAAANVRLINIPASVHDQEGEDYWSFFQWLVKLDQSIWLFG